MSCSRRNFLAGAGAVIFTTGVAGTAAVTSRKTLANVQEDGAKRYGMVHDETACIGCTACTEACREVNKVPEGVSRLEIIKSEPQGEYPNVDYRFTRNSCQHCDNAPCVMVCPTGAAYKDEKTGIVDVHKESVWAVATVYLLVHIKCAFSILKISRPTNVTSVVIPILHKVNCLLVLNLALPMR